MTSALRFVRSNILSRRHFIFLSIIIDSSCASPRLKTASMMELRIEPSAQQHNNSILYEACVQAIEQAWHLPVVERGVVDTELVHSGDTWEESKPSTPARLR